VLTICCVQTRTALIRTPSKERPQPHNSLLDAQQRREAKLVMLLREQQVQSGKAIQELGIGMVSL
jgi:hypothetical protein